MNKDPVSQDHSVPFRIGVLFTDSPVRLSIWILLLRFYKRSILGPRPLETVSH